jgi:hypothetical protein
VGAGVCLGLPACANILGLEDRTEALTDGSTGATTSASVSATTGTATSGSSSTSSTLGDAGIDDAAHDARGKGQGDATVEDSGDAEVPEASSACPATGPCIIASGLDYPWTIAVDEQRVYWTEPGTDITTSNGFVKSCPVTGCGAGGPTVYASNVNFPRDIVIDSTSVYWGTVSLATPGGIWKCPLAGCVGVPTQIGVATQPYGMALDGTYVYWVDQFDNSVHRASKAGGGVNQVLDDGGSTVHGEPERASVDNAFVYFTDNSGEVLSLPFDGGTARVIRSNDSVGDYPVVVDSTWVYYGATNNALATTNNASATDFFFRADKKANNPAQTPLVSNVNWAYGIALDPDAGQLYFADFGDTITNSGAYGRVSLDGGGLQYLGQHLAPIEWVAVNSTYLFYAIYSSDNNYTPNTGTLVRTAK